MHIFTRLYLVCTAHLHRVSWPSVLVGSAIHYLICWTAFQLTGEADLSKMPDFFYFMSVVGSSLGFGDMSPTTMAGKLFVAFYQIPASLAIFGTVLGKLITLTRAGVERNINGMRNFKNHSGHVIVIGWHEKQTQKMIDCILADEHRQNGRILLCVKDEDLTHPLPDYDQVDFARLNCFSDEREFERIAAQSANRVIIHGENDEQTLTAALSLSPEVKDDCHIVAYFDNPKNAELLDKHCKNVESGTNRAAELLARSMQDPGSTRVLSHLLNPQTGATQFSLTIPPHADDVSVGELSHRMKADNNATLIAVSTMQSGDDVELNPDSGRTLTSGNCIHYIASKRILKDEINWQKKLNVSEH